MFRTWIMIACLMLISGLAIAQTTPVLTEVQTFKEKGDAINENGWFLGLAFSPNGKCMAVSTHTAYLLVWDLVEGKKLVTRKIAKGRHMSLKSLLFTPDSKKLVFRKNDKQIAVWNLELDQEVQAFDFPHRDLETVKVTTDGKLLIAVGRGEFTTESKIVTWSMETGAKVLEIVSKKVISDIAVSPDGSKLACASTGGIPIYDLATGEELNRFEEKVSSRAVAFSNDGKIVAFTTMPNPKSSVINLWELKDDKKIAELTGLPSSIIQLVFSADASLIAARTDRYFFVYNVASNKHAEIEMRDLEGVQFTIDSKCVAAAGKIDKKPCVVLWKIELK